MHCRFARYESRIWRGAYPHIYDRALAPTDFYPAYIQTYVERDARLLKNIGDANVYFDNLRYWRSLASLPEGSGYVVYGGDQSLRTGVGMLVSWRDIGRLIE